jgi:predicted small lipoprotein YifL
MKNGFTWLLIGLAAFVIGCGDSGTAPAPSENPPAEKAESEEVKTEDATSSNVGQESSSSNLVMVSLDVPNMT